MVARLSGPVCAGLAAATTAATFAPWATSGSRSRSSYAVVDVVERAGVLPPSWASVSVAWYFLPALCGLVIVLVAWSRTAFACGAAATLGAVVVTGGVLVARSPLGTEPGATVGALLGAFTAVAGVIALADETRSERRER